MKLGGMRTYLAGAMDRVDDGGVGWRNEITPELEALGVTVLNPCDKPCLLYTSPSPRDRQKSRMPSSA